MASTTKQMNITAGNAQATVNATVNDSMPTIPCPDPAGYRYVGARYVPLFADPLQWSSANTYEPLTIVVSEGNSYTSRTYVPVGIDISNTDYWALTGNYNAQVEQYRQEVTRYQTAVDQYQEDVEQYQSQVYALSTAPIKAILIGDSYLREYTDNPGWGDQFETYTGWDCIRYKSGGAGWVAEGTSDTEAGLNFLGMLDKAHTEHTSDNMEYRAIVVQGIINDLQTNQDVNDIRTNIATFCQNAHSYFPNATVYISTAVCSKQYQYNSKLISIVKNLRDLSLQNMRVQVYAVNSYYWFLNHVDEWGRGDDIHPNEIGYAKLSQYIAMNCLGNPCAGDICTFTYDDILTLITEQYPDFETYYNITYARTSIINGFLTVNLGLSIKELPAEQRYVFLPGFTTLNVGTEMVLDNQCTLTSGGNYVLSPVSVTVINNENEYGCTRINLRNSYPGTTLAIGDEIRFNIQYPNLI